MKNKIIIVALAAAASILMAVSCQKQEQFSVYEQEQEQSQATGDGMTFTATIEQALTKTTITDERKVEWEYSDRISINGALYSAVPKTPASRADFIHMSGNAPKAPYKAIYPATLYNASTKGYELPSTITYKGGLDTPMYAESDTEELSFKNICGVLCLSLAGTEVVKSITVTADKNICGPFTVETAQDGTVSMALTGDDTDANKSVTLDFGKNPIALMASYTELYEHDQMAFKFYIPIPAGTYNDLIVTVATEDVLKPELKKISQEAITIEPNTIYTLSWDVIVPIADHLSRAFRDMVDNQPKFAVASGEAVMPEHVEANPFLPAIHTWEYNYSAIEKITAMMYLFETAGQETVQGWTAGQLRFLRALLYFELFRTYGEIPILENSDPISYSEPLSYGEIAYFIKEELNDDVEYNRLPDSYEEGDRTVDLGGGIEITRPTKWAVLSLLARTGLYCYSPLFNVTGCDFTKQEAIEYCKAIIDGKRGDGLLPVYCYWWGGKDEDSDCVDEYDNLDNPEMIFGVRYTGPYFEGVYPSNVLITTIDDTDPRKGMSFTESESAPNRYVLKKGIADGKNTHVLPIFRYGETLLEYAELYEDASSLSEVQRRAGLPETPYSFDNCRSERYKELAFEGQFFWDARRWKRGEDEWGDNWDDDYYFYPRPDGSRTSAL